VRERALIVDEEPASCELIERILRSVGMEFTTLQSSMEAPSILDGGKFSLVFLDQHMASPDGIDLTRQIRESGFNRTTPIIMLNDDRRPGGLSRAFEAGASFFLYKPIDKDRLLKLVRATQGNMEHERRKTRRVPFRSKVSLRNGPEEIQCETLDISLEGFLVQAPRIFPIGSSVDVRLDVPKNGRPIVGGGTVVRLIEGNRMGIHLGRLPLAESEKLQELLLPLIARE
jgi:CheY-like chemotaxis protein